MSASRKHRIAVVSGGFSSEAFVSRASGAGVADALVRRGHDVTRIELDAQVSERLREGGFDAAFALTHGAFGEDGCLQGVFEVLGLPYVGADVLASAVAMSKPMAKLAFAAAGLPLARGLVAYRESGEDPTRIAERALRDVGSRLVVKPAANGSAIGVARLEAGASVSEVAQAIEAAFAVDSAVLIEHFAKGREVTCGVLDLHPEAARELGLTSLVGEGPVAFSPTEILAESDAFYTYEARYAPGRSRHVCPAELPPGVSERVRQVAVAAHRAVGARDLCRADFVVGDVDDPSAVTLLEVNTLPGFTATSLYPEAAGVFGLPLETLCEALVKSAIARGPRARNEGRPLPT